MTTTKPADIMALSPATPPTTSSLDSLDAIFDFSEYESLSYQSPSGSPDPKHTMPVVRQPVVTTPPVLPTTASGSQPVLSGPSHQYDLYKQQTGIPQGAVASTLAANQDAAHMNQFAYANSYLAPAMNDDYLEFGAPANPSSRFQPDADMDYDSPPGDQQQMFFPSSAPHDPVRHETPEFHHPNGIGSVMAAPPPARLWPGMHQQQALAKAQAQQQQQRAMMQQQQPPPATSMAKTGKGTVSNKSKASGAADPLVEEKITQLLQSMRQNNASMSADAGADDEHLSGHVGTLRLRKEEEDMDEDERLLASEEGKKLSSKERRQLRNKVSARAFRSRRKEYISQLEGELAGKANENHDLRHQNRALMEENTRLSDLTRMLLSSPAFSGFLDTLATDPAVAHLASSATSSITRPASTATAASAAQRPMPQDQERSRTARDTNARQTPKDANPHASQQQQHMVGMTMVPELASSFSIFDQATDSGFAFQPQVYTMELPMQESLLDLEALSGKPRDPLSRLDSEAEKVELPTVEVAPMAPNVDCEVGNDSICSVADSDFDADPRFALFASPAAATPVEMCSTVPDRLDILWKPTYRLVVTPSRTSTHDDHDVESNLGHLTRLCDALDAMADRLELLTGTL